MHPLGGGDAAPMIGRAAVEIPTAQMSPARVVELLRAGGEDARVAQQGATALVALSGGRGLRADRVAALTAIGEDYEARCQNCVDLGAVGCLVAALRTHASVPAVAEEACSVLCNIAGIPAGQDACVSEGAVPAIVAALRAHPSVPAVAQCASQALLNIGWTNPSHRAAIVAAGAVPLLAAAFSAHTGEARQKAHEALGKLDYTDEGVSKEAAAAAMYARISSTRGELGPILRFAGGPEAEWPCGLFRTLRYVLLHMLTTRDANALRLVCKELKREVEEHPWEDMETVIRGYVGERVGERKGQRGAWRACFPKARGANVNNKYLHRRTDVVDADFVHFVGLRVLNISECEQVTDAAFVHLQGIHTLNMWGCNQPTITDAAFANLRGIHTLRMSHCDQPTITDAAFANLRGIHTLDMSYCNQRTITDTAFGSLRGIHTLNMSCCNQPTISDAAFANLCGIHTLAMGCCNQPTITDAAFANLRGIHTLEMHQCDQPTITDAAFANLCGIHTLAMGCCNQPTITDAAFADLRGIHTLRMNSCDQWTITDAAFANLGGIHTLDMRNCNQPTITGLAFEPLIGIRELSYRGDYCTYSYPSGLAGGPLAGLPHELVMPLDFGRRIKGPLCLWRAANPMALIADVSRRRDLTDADFVYLRGIQALNMSECDQPTITDAAFANLAGIQKLHMLGCLISAIASARALGLPAKGQGSFGPRIEGPIAAWRAANPTALVANVEGRKDLTDADFVHLRGIRYLKMRDCNRRTITDAAFANLPGIHTLDMSKCDQSTITDAAFVNLRGIHTLNMSQCDQRTITDAAFANLRGIHTLDMGWCYHPTITGLAFEPLIGITELTYRGDYCTYSYPSGLASGSHASPPPHEFVMPLDVDGKPNFGPRIRGPLCLWRAANPTALVADVSGRLDLTDADFVYLRGICALNMRECNQSTITDAAFANLRGIHTLNMYACYQSTITDVALANLAGIHTLNMPFCSLIAAARARGLPATER